VINPLQVIEGGNDKQFEPALLDGTWRIASRDEGGGMIESMVTLSRWYVETVLANRVECGEICTVYAKDSTLHNK